MVLPENDVHDLDTDGQKGVREAACQAESVLVHAEKKARIPMENLGTTLMTILFFVLVSLTAKKASERSMYGLAMVGQALLNLNALMAVHLERWGLVQVPGLVRGILIVAALFYEGYLFAVIFWRRKRARREREREAQSSRGWSV